MTRTKATLLAVTLSFLVAPAASAQYAGLQAVQQEMIKAQKEAEETKAKEEVQKAKEAERTESGTSNPDGSSTSTTSGGESKPGEDQKSEDRKPEEKKPEEKKVEEKKEDPKKAEEEKKAEAAKKAEEDKKAEEEKKKEEEKKAAEDKKLLENKEAYNPMKDAIFAMNTGKFNESLNLLTQVIAKDSKNWQAHYLLAVTYVNLRKYAEAATQYKKVMQFAANPRLAKLAADGLSKIPH